MAEQDRRPAAPVVSAGARTGRSSARGLALQIGMSHPELGVILVQLRGTLDGVGAAELQRRLAEATRPGDQVNSRILLDLSAVAFLDHVGLDALLQLQERWTANNGSVELLAPSPSVVRLLHETDLDGESWMQEVPDAARGPRPA